VQIQKWVPQCKMAWPVRVQVWRGELVEGGGPIGGFLYEVNEWREICRWEN
jgi:hypothetical protein